MHYVCLRLFFSPPTQGDAMTEPTTLTHSPSEILNPGLAVLRPLLGAAALGFVVLYGVAFAEARWRTTPRTTCATSPSNPATEQPFFTGRPS
jgi:hypothetical protein